MYPSSKHVPRRFGALRALSPAILSALAAVFAPPVAVAAPRDPSVPVWRRVGPGVMHGHWTRPEGPWNINALTVNLDDPHIRIESEPGGDRLFTGETVPATAKRESRPGHTVVAAINADFWSSGQRLYTPVGMSVANGYLARLPAKRSGFAMVDGNRAVMGQVPLRTRAATAVGGLGISRLNDPATTLGATLFTPPYGSKVERLPVPAVAVTLDQEGFLPNRPATGRVSARALVGGDIALATGTVVIAAPEAELAAAGLDAVGTSVTLTADAPAAPGVITAATGGMPEILRDGVAVDRLARDGAGKDFSTTLHPRTAVGLTSGGRTLVMVTVDGRQPGFSAGQSLPELTRTMRELGCTDAVNLDGGGSTCMVVRDEVVNRPSDAIGPRKVANSLLVVSTAPVGEVAELRLEPDLSGLTLPANAPVTVEALAFDLHANPIPRVKLPINFSQSYDADTDREFTDDESSAADGHDDGSNAIRFVCGDSEDESTTTTLSPQFKYGDGILQASFWAEVHDDAVIAEDRRVFRGQTVYCHPDFKPSKTSKRSNIYKNYFKFVGTSVVFRVDHAVGLDVAPDPIILSTSETMSLHAVVRGKSGAHLYFRPEMLSADSMPKIVTSGGFASLTGMSGGSGFVDFRVGDAERRVAVHVDRYTSVSLEGFEGYPTTGPATSKNMVTTATSAAAVADNREGTASLRVDYAMAKRGGRSELTIPIDRPVAAAPAKFALSIYGDGREAWVRGTLIDAKGRRFAVDFTDGAAGVRWAGEWRRREVQLGAVSPAGETHAGTRPEFPARFVSLTVSQDQEALKAAGTLRFDSLEAVYPPNPPAPSAPYKTALDIATPLSHTSRP